MRIPQDNALIIIRPQFFFSRNTPQEDKDMILADAGIPATQCFDKYLGLLALVGRS
jgi:hypothetical protein